MSSVHVDKFQQRKDANSEKYMEQFIQSTGLMPSDKDFYVQLEAYMEAQYVKEAMDADDIPAPMPTKEKKKESGLVLSEVNEKAYVLISQDKDNFIQGVVVGDSFFVATKKEITTDYLFELVEKGIITAKQAQEMIFISG